MNVLSRNVTTPIRVSTKRKSKGCSCESDRHMLAIGAFQNVEQRHRWSRVSPTPSVLLDVSSVCGSTNRPKKRYLKVSGRRLKKPAVVRGPNQSSQVTVDPSHNCLLLTRVTPSIGGHLDPLTSRASRSVSCCGTKHVRGTVTSVDLCDSSPGDCRETLLYVYQIRPPRGRLLKSLHMHLQYPLILLQSFISKSRICGIVACTCFYKAGMLAPMQPRILYHPTCMVMMPVGTPHHH